MENLDVKTRRTNERGIGWVSVFILILILVLLAFGGYVWVERRLGPIEDKLNTLSKQSSATPATQAPSLPTTDDDGTTYTSAKGDVIEVDAPLKMHQLKARSQLEVKYLAIGSPRESLAYRSKTPRVM